MTCTESRNLFSARVDGALAPAESAALDAHLAGCAECRRELAGFERSVALTRALEPARAPAGFVDRVLAAARPAPWPARLARRLFVPWPKIPLGAAALLLVAGLAVMLFRGSAEQERFSRVETAPPAVPAPAVPAPAVGQAPAAVQAPATVPAPARQLEPAKPAEQQAAAPRPTDNVLAATDRRQAPAAAPEEQREKKERADSKRADLAKNQAKNQAKDQYEEAARLRRDGESPPPAVAQGKLEAPRQAPAEAQTRLGAAKSQAVPLSAAALPDVTARLRATDVAAAERALVEATTRLGGRQTARRSDAGLVVVDLAVPREAWPKLAREAGALGALSVDREGLERPVLTVVITISN